MGQLIYGRIIDKISHEPLPLASIKLGLRGTISSHEGYFKISIKEIDHQRKNKLIISFIGFKHQELSIDGLKDPVIIEMESTEKYLDEVKITNGAEEIIKKVIKKLALNYAEKSYAMFGTQSEELENQDQAKIYYLEAELQSIMPKFHSGNKIKIELKNLRQKDFSNADSSNFVIWGATGRAIEYFDFSSAYYSVLDSSKLKKYRFIVEDLMLANRPVYKISFTNKKIKENSKESYLLIEKSSYAILSFAVESINNDNLWALMHQSVIRVDYQKLHEKWYLKSLYHEHISQRWPFNKNKFDRLKIKVQIDRIDTLVNFDIDYAKNIQRADILYLKVQGKLTKEDSMKLKTIHSILPKKKNRFIKFWYQNITIGTNLTYTPFNYSEKSFDQRFREDAISLDHTYHLESKMINPVLIGATIDLKLNRFMKLNYEANTNLGIGGRKMIYGAIGTKFEKYFQRDKRPLGVYLNPKLGIFTQRITIEGLQTFTASQLTRMKLDDRPVQLEINKANVLASLALGFSFEITRRKHLNLEIQYNYTNNELINLAINDPEKPSYFSQNKVISQIIIKNPKSSINFSIKLF